MTIRPSWHRWRAQVLLVFGIFLVVSQTGGSAIVTAETRPRIKPDLVKIYLNAPQKFKVMGLIEATGTTLSNDQVQNDRAVIELKEKAAAIGANGVLFQSIGNRTDGALYAARITRRHAAGEAIYVIEP